MALHFHYDSGDRSIDFVRGSEGIWRPLRVEVHFERVSGSGTEVATLTISRVSQRGDKFNTTLLTVLNRGVGADLVARWPDWEARTWSFPAGDSLKVAWTNPDTVNPPPSEIRWALEMVLESDANS